MSFIMCRAICWHRMHDGSQQIPSSPLPPFNSHESESAGFAQFSSSTCHRREPLVISDTGFYGPDDIPVTQPCQGTEENTLHRPPNPPLHSWKKGCCQLGLQVHWPPAITATLCSVSSSVTEPMQMLKNRPWPFDLRVSACRGPAVIYRSTEFGIDSSGRFPCRARTDKQTNRRNWTLYQPLGCLAAYGRLSLLNVLSLSVLNILSAQKQGRPIRERAIYIQSEAFAYLHV